MEMIIPTACDGLLLRTYLSRELGLSRRTLAHLKQRKDGILLDGHHVTVRTVLKAGQRLTLSLDDADAQTSVIPNGTMPPILYEDDDILICNKPGNMPTHPSHGHFDDTLANAVAAYDMDRTGHAPVFRPVNRLDRETSGTVLIARNRRAAAKLSEQMQKKHIQKTYLAILDGVPSPVQGKIDLPIRRAAESIILREVCSPDAVGAQSALTNYRVLCEWSDGSHRRCLVLAEPHTGRTHQLRVHFAHLGAPIAGDGLYGRRDIPSAYIPVRQCLHALSLSFFHPTTDERMSVCAPLPDDIFRHIPDDVQDVLADLIFTDKYKEVTL